MPVECPTSSSSDLVKRRWIRGIIGDDLDANEVFYTRVPDESVSTALWGNYERATEWAREELRGLFVDHLPDDLRIADTAPVINGLRRRRDRRLANPVQLRDLVRAGFELERVRDLDVDDAALLLAGRGQYLLARVGEPGPPDTLQYLRGKRRTEMLAQERADAVERARKLIALAEDMSNPHESQVAQMRLVELREQYQFSKEELSSR